MGKEWSQWHQKKTYIHFSVLFSIVIHYWHSVLWAWVKWCERAPPMSMCVILADCWRRHCFYMNASCIRGTISSSQLFSVCCVFLFVFKPFSLYVVRKHSAHWKHLISVLSPKQHINIAIQITTAIKLLSRFMLLFCWWPKRRPALMFVYIHSFGKLWSKHMPIVS